jgi:carbamate kinase
VTQVLVDERDAAFETPQKPIGAFMSKERAEEHRAKDGWHVAEDKDLASSLLARRLRAETLVISTAVERVCLDFGKPTQRALAEMTAAEARRHAADGQFKPGSMLPKVQAIVEFLEAGGKEGVITDPAHLPAALAGRGGTRIVP